MKLGKLPARRDARNLKLRAVLRAAAPPPPDAYDVDEQFGGPLPDSMFLNDIYGCCVIAGRAHHTRRLELVDQGGLIFIPDEAVRAAYFAETGGIDSGLVVQTSLKAWRRGWGAWKPAPAIIAFAEIDPQDRAAVQAAIYGANGVGLGLGLPLSARRQFNAHEAWEEVTPGPDWQPYGWGGHYVYCLGYDPAGLTCISWGRRQRMSWGFLERYCDEAYSVIDARTPSYRAGQIDAAKVAAFVASLA